MEAVKPGGGGGVVGVVDDDMGEGMQCSDHPYRKNPGGICAFCLQEKLGKLLTSSSSKFNSSFFPVPVAPSSSSSSPSFRSDTAGGGGGSLSLSLSTRPNSSHVGSSGGGKDCHYQYCSRRARIPFILAQKKKKNEMDHHHASVALKRSKSTATPRRRHFMEDACDGDDYSRLPQKRGGFWSFLYLSKPNSTKRTNKIPSVTTATAAVAAVAAATAGTGASSAQKHKDKKCDIVDESESPNASSTPSFGRKVSRSRSVGCGSRSFSGDFFERISTGFGDCTLRRVESQREGKTKVAGAHRGAGGAHEHHHCIKERVKCGGIFSGFIMNSSSSSSSSSTYWVSTSAEDVNGKSTAAAVGALAHGRSKSWGWAFASPIRAFSKPSSKENKRDVVREASNKNTTPNLAAIPSLLAVRG